MGGGGGGGGSGIHPFDRIKVKWPQILKQSRNIPLHFQIEIKGDDPDRRAMDDMPFMTICLLWYFYRYPLRSLTLLFLNLLSQKS